MKNICTDQNKSIHALGFYHSQFHKRYTIKECPYPCTFMKTAFRSKTKLGQKQELILNFNKFIKTTKARYAYRELELLAEFGGYVGLFLGISIFDLRQAFVKVILPIINN